MHVQRYKLDTLKNLKLHFKMLPSQNDLNMALGVGVCQIYFYYFVYEYLYLIFK